MIKNLTIKNIAVIDTADVELGGGFNVLTGETGAGKSIIIDSINMLKGERISKSIIRSGESKAKVTAIADVNEQVEKFVTETLDIECDGELMISREINTDGKDSIRINGVPATLTVIKQLGDKLINIHGQHDNTSLLAKKNHIIFLDEYAKHSLKPKYDEYKKIYDEYNSVKNKLDKSQADEQQKNQRLDILKYQIDEIEEAQLKPGEDTELETRRDFLDNIQSIADATQTAYVKIYEGSDYSPSAHDLIWDGINEIENVQEYDERLKQIHDELADAAYIIGDKTRELKSLFDSIDYDGEELSQIEQRLDTIYNLKRKYGNTVEQILEYYDKISTELDEIINSDENNDKLKEQLARLERARREKADELTKIRSAAAKELSDGIMKELCDLEMSKVKFKVNITPCDYNANGADDVEFLICTNVGDDFKPLTKIASGGELSRIMLAMKSVYASGEAADTLIFDEIDTGVSGRAAQAIGEKLVKISRQKQVICITHLPQIAALADSHYLIQKHTDLNSTHTTVDLIKGNQRAAELARTLGGAEITEITLKNAEELINQANEIKNRYTEE